MSASASPIGAVDKGVANSPVFADFFRHSVHIEDIFLPERRQERPFRAWSAGCGSGATAYAIAMLADSHLDQHQPWEVIASDQDPDALLCAKSRRYRTDDVASIPEPYRTLYCRETRAKQMQAIDLRLRRRVFFVNLDPYRLLPPFLPFDLICLDGAAAGQSTRPIAHLLPLLRPGGYLISSAGRPPGAEALIQVSDAVFQRRAA